ncbi:hypothetical protein UFOVP585_10 [uncultured Caudovirales phage]|uniref:Uncharacterized protein n=1 Tax=uncultured Caudovirales phage TaxID=2100421 RepID=A0A6J5N1X8_9CAUD|nr:hypothetical protein UFOVP585_10 [uncultured Caudovirales phage]
MAGTKLGGEKASVTNKARYGKGYYAMIGSKGGKKTGMKGFALNLELASKAGRKGGLRSRRGRVSRAQD